MSWQSINIGAICHCLAGCSVKMEVWHDEPQRTGWNESGEISLSWSAVSPPHHIYRTSGPLEEVMRDVSAFKKLAEQLGRLPTEEEWKSVEDVLDDRVEWACHGDEDRLRFWQFVSAVQKDGVRHRIPDGERYGVCECDPESGTTKNWVVRQSGGSVVWIEQTRTKEEALEMAALAATERAMTGKETAGKGPLPEAEFSPEEVKAAEHGAGWDQTP